MKTPDFVDVTVIEPKLKHPTIFEHFDALEGGDSLIIHNDHDPKPLYYQLLGERGNIFKWEYLTEGPDFWKVQITKYASGEEAATIGELVAKDFRKAEVFKKYGIDFCCGGKKTLQNVCNEKGIDVTQVESELKSLETSKNTEIDFEKMEPDQLVDYILSTHHAYINNAYPYIVEYTQKVSNVHGEYSPETVKIAGLFFDLMNELHSHMEKEEMLLFPYIRQLAEAKRNNNQVEYPGFGTVRNPVRMMEHEHDVAGEIMRQISQLSNNYIPPAHACTTFRLSYAKLQEFEEDLHKHIHLENNILFPKAIELEQSILN